LLHQLQILNTNTQSLY